MSASRHQGGKVTRVLDLDHYVTDVAVFSGTFNEWRANLVMHTTEHGTIVDLRFVDDPSLHTDQVDEHGPSVVYMPIGRFDSVLHVLQSERGLSLQLEGAPTNCVLLRAFRQVIALSPAETPKV